MRARTPSAAITPRARERPHRHLFEPYSTNCAVLVVDVLKPLNDFLFRLPAETLRV